MPPDQECGLSRRPARPDLASFLIQILSLDGGTLVRLGDVRVDAQYRLRLATCAADPNVLVHSGALEVLISSLSGGSERFARATRTRPVIFGILMWQRWPGLQRCRRVGIAPEENAGFATRGCALPDLEWPRAADRSGTASLRDRRGSHGVCDSARARRSCCAGTDDIPRTVDRQSALRACMNAPSPLEHAGSSFSCFKSIWRCNRISMVLVLLLCNQRSCGIMWRIAQSPHAGVDLCYVD